MSAFLPNFSIETTSIFSAVNELSPLGALQSYMTTPEGVISGPFDTVSSGGSGPAFTAALTTGQVAIMNYNSGTGKAKFKKS